MKVRALALAAALVVVIGLPAAAAPPEKIAWGDGPGDCFAVATNTVGGYECIVGAATGFIVINDNNWTLVAKAEATKDLPYAVKLDPDSSGYCGGCYAGVGLPTQHWQSVTTPSGNANIVCQGVME